MKLLVDALDVAKANGCRRCKNLSIPCTIKRPAIKLLSRCMADRNQKNGPWLASGAGPDSFRSKVLVCSSVRMLSAGIVRLLLLHILADLLDVALDLGSHSWIARGVSVSQRLQEGHDVVLALITETESSNGRVFVRRNLRAGPAGLLDIGIVLRGAHGVSRVIKVDHFFQALEVSIVHVGFYEARIRTLVDVAQCW